VDLITSQGAKFTWGGIEFYATSISVRWFASDDIDISSMASDVMVDADNTSAKYVIKDRDCSMVEAELSIDFFARGAVFNGMKIYGFVGQSKDLKFSLPRKLKPEQDGYNPFEGLTHDTDPGQADPSNPQFRFLKRAILKNINLDVSPGEYVKGNAAFVLSGKAPPPLQE